MGRRGRGHGPYAWGDDQLIAPRGPAHALAERLASDGRVITAARVAHTFPGLDPVAVLDETDPLKRLLRVVAHNVIAKDSRSSSTSTG